MHIWRKTDSGAWLLISSQLLAAIPMGFLIVALPIYLDHIGLHPELIGTLFTISGIASAALLVVFGILADRYGRKLFVVVGTALPVLSYLILASTISRPLLLVASAVGGIGLAGGMSGALVTSGYNALLSEKSSPEVRTSVFSIAEMAWVVAVFIGSLLAGLPHQLQTRFGQSYQSSFHSTFVLLLALGVLSTLVVLPVQEDKRAIAARPHWLPRASARRIGLLSLTLGMLGLGLGFIVQLLPLWFHLQFHVSEAFLGPWFGVAQILALGSLALAAPVSRTMGPVPFVVLTQGLASAVLVLMAFAPGASVAAMLWVCRTIVMNASWPVQQSYIMGVVEPSERASASSLTYAAWSITGALTPPIGGALLGAHLYTVPFLLGAVCYAIAIGIFYWFFHAVHPLPEEREVTAYGPAPAAD